MILRTTTGASYRVDFRHFVPCKPVRIKGKGRCAGVSAHKPQFSRGPKTECLVYSTGVGNVLHTDNGVDRPLARTEARLKPGDTFTKAMGRRIALGRALTELTVMGIITPAQRDQLFADYFTKVAPR